MGIVVTLAGWALARRKHEESFSITRNGSCLGLCGVTQVCIYVYEIYIEKLRLSLLYFNK